MKLIFTVVTCAIAVNLQAQKVVLEFSSAPFVTSLSFFEKKGITWSANLNSKKFQPQYAFSVSSKIKGYFYIKSEAGYTVMNSVLNANFKNTDGIERTISNGQYAASIISLALLPEVRYSSKRVYGFFNTGVGSYSTVSGTLQPEVYLNRIKGSDFNGTSIGFLQNIGIGVKLKEVGLFTSYGMSYILPHKNVSYLPGLSYWQYYFRVGISYHIQQ